MKPTDSKSIPTQGLFVKNFFWSDKNISQTIPYKDGKKDGVSIYYSQGGQKQTETLYKRGKRHGITTLWHSKGTKVLTYKNDKKHGVERGWNESGKIESESMWANGAENGVETWRHENGSKLYEIYYLHNKGYAMIKWDEEGKVIDVKFQPYNPITKPQANPIAELKKRIKGWLN